jgi:putative inorganic carbon (hco3(-)) transporter
MASFAATILRRQALHSETRRLLLRVAVIVLGTLMALGMSAAVGTFSQGSLVILGAIGGSAAIYMVLRPSFGMYVLCVFIYFDASNLIEIQWGIPSLNKILVALILIGVIGTRAIVLRQRLVIRPTEGAILLYGFAITMSIFFSANASDAFDQLVDFAKDFALVLIIIQLCDDESAWKKLQWTMVGAATLLSALTCYHMLTGDTSNNFFGLANAPVHEITFGFDSVRPTGPLADPNFYAQILLMVFPIAAYRTVDEKTPRNKFIGLICSGLIVGAIIFTYSRSAFIMIVFVSVLIVLERKMNLYKFAALAGVILLVATPILPAGYLERMATLTGATEGSESQSEASFRGRSSEAQVAILMFFDHPLLGIGYANYEENYLYYSARLGIDNRLQNREAHSLYLEAAAETGVVGLFAFTLMYLLIFRSLWLARKQLIQIGRLDLVSWVTGLAFGLMGYLLTSIFLHDDYVRYLRLMIGLALSASALSDALYIKYNQEKTHKALVASPYEGMSITDSSK